MPLEQADIENFELWSIRDRVQSAVQQAVTNMSGDEASIGSSLMEALVFVERLKEVPAWRFPTQSPFPNIQTSLLTIESVVQKVIDNPEANIADELTRHFDTLVSHLNSCPNPTITSGHLSGIAAISDSYRRTVSEAIDALRTDADQTIERTGEKLAALKEEISQHQASLTAQTERLDKALNQNSETFSRSLEKWQQEATAEASKIKSDGETAIAEAEEEAAASRRDLRARGQDTLERLEDLESQARNLVEATGRGTITHEFGQHAKVQERFATAWSIAAVAVALGGFIFMANVIGGLEAMTAPEAIWKTTVSALVLAVAGYMGREAAGHRNVARDAKHTQLNLNALEPFLANLKETKAEHLRESFAKIIFSRPVATSRTRPEFSWPSDTGGDKSEKAAAKSGDLDK